MQVSLPSVKTCAIITIPHKTAHSSKGGKDLPEQANADMINFEDGATSFVLKSSYTQKKLSKLRLDRRSITWIDICQTEEKKIPKIANVPCDCSQRAALQPKGGPPTAHNQLNSPCRNGVEYTRRAAMTLELTITISTLWSPRTK